MNSPAKARSSWPDQPASLELLAPEILLPIVTSLPSLDTLWNLLRASPHAWRLFNSRALAITEGILSSPNSILPPKIQELVRGVILARSEALPFRNLDEFHLQFMRGQIPFSEPPDAAFISLGPETLPASIVSVAVLRSVVTTAYHISALSQSCLASCLERLRDPSFRPLHAFDPTPHYTHSYGPNGDWVPACDRKFVVQCLVVDKADTIGWSNEAVEMLSTMDPVDLIENPGLVLGKAEEVKSAMLYLRTLGDATKNIYYRLPRPLASARWITPLPKPKEYTWVLYGFRRNNKFHRLEKGSPVPEDGKPVNRPVCNDAFHWGQTEDALKLESVGMRYFRSVTMGNDSPIAGVKFDSFRLLGFAFWDKWRMHLLGLTDGVHPLYFQEDFDFFA